MATTALRGADRERVLCSGVLHAAGSKHCALKLDVQTVRILGVPTGRPFNYPSMVQESKYQLSGRSRRAPAAHSRSGQHGTLLLQLVQQVRAPVARITVQAK